MMLDPKVSSGRTICAIAAAVALVAMPGASALARLTIDYASFLPLYLLIAIMAAAIPYTAWRKMQRLRSAFEASALGLLMTLPVLVFSYAAMRTGLPLADGWLMAADRAIGFDWPAFVQWVDRHPMLAAALACGYSSFSIQLMLLPILLDFEARAYQMVLGYLLLCCAAIAISIFFPSLGAYEGHGLDGRTLTNVNAHFGYFFLQSFNAVRTDPNFSLSLGVAAGIITFPSIHAGVALLCGWAAWASPLLRLPFAILNLLMAVSAISHGGHYLVDIIAGFVVAAAAIAAVLGITRGDRPTVLASPAVATN
jgi:hypothetical protein